MADRHVAIYRGYCYFWRST